MFRIAGTASVTPLDPELGYQPHLISSLAKDHEALLDLLAEAQELASKSRFSELSRTLRVFQGKFQSHIMAENMKLYLYLTISLSDKAAQKTLVSRLRREIKAVKSVFLNILDNYGDNRVNSTNVDACLVDIGKFHKILEQRFTEEESCLYPLYSPIQKT